MKLAPFIPLVVYLLALWVQSVQLNQNCTGHLKRAADANTIELAAQELSAAVSYLEANGMTDGYTSVVYQTPDEDVGFWYKNLKASLAELRAVGPQAAQLERTNVLMKLRETLLDSGERGTRVTRPDGLARFPNNAPWAFAGFIVAALAAWGFVRFDD